jgi:hypothetical protein
MIVSAVLVHLYRLDSRTGTVFVTNNLLLLTRWSKGLAVANQSLAEEKAISFYTFKQTVFNVIDPDYKKAVNGLNHTDGSQPTDSGTLVGQETAKLVIVSSSTPASVQEV